MSATGDAGPLAGITPENVIDPPACSTAEFIRSDPERAVRATWSTLLDRLAESSRHEHVWRSLSVISRRALEDVHDGCEVAMAGATRACLVRKELIQSNGAITLLGRQVVHEARTNDQISRTVDCQMRARYPAWAVWLDEPPGCCTSRLAQDIRTCPCSCHLLRRVTPSAAVG